MFKKILSLVFIITSVSCSHAYYSVWEALGKHKRDLLKDHVLAVKEEQEEAQQQFKDALTRLRTEFPREDTELSQKYDSLQADYDDSLAKAEAVSSRIKKIHSVSTDLFEEWEEEAETITSRELRNRSREQLREATRRYEKMRSRLLSSEQAMEPVLTKFRDYVLYVKHNLNAESLGALEGEARDIENGIDTLISHMQRSIGETEAFIATL